MEPIQDNSDATVMPSTRAPKVLEPMELKPKRKPLPLYERWFEYECRGYPLFTEDELLQALENDGRFVLTAHPILEQRGISLWW